MLLFEVQVLRERVTRNELLELLMACQLQRNLRLGRGAGSVCLLFAFKACLETAMEFIGLKLKLR